jgi:hypothetical protein
MDGWAKTEKIRVWGVWSKKRPCVESGDLQALSGADQVVLESVGDFEFGYCRFLLQSDAIEGVALRHGVLRAEEDFLAVDFEGVDFFFVELLDAVVFLGVEVAGLLGVVFFVALKA